MFFRGQKTSLCLVIVGLITVHTIGVNHPHHWCAPCAPMVLGLRTTCAKHPHVYKKGKKGFIVAHSQYGVKGHMT